jgi:hypothetical protein
MSAALLTLALATCTSISHQGTATDDTVRWTSFAYVRLRRQAEVDAADALLRHEIDRAAGAQ